MSKPALSARLLDAFLADLEEQLDNLNRALLSLELNPANPEALKTVFRVMHTLKGAAHATDQPVVERACHHLEAMLSTVRDGDTSLGPAQFALMFAAADALADTAKRLATGNVIDESSPIALLLSELEIGLAQSPPADTSPALPVIVAATPEVTEPAAPTPASVPPPTQSTSSGSPESAVRVSAEKLDVLLSQVGQLLAARARIAEHAAATAALDDAVSKAHAGIRRLLSDHSAALSVDAVRAVRDVELLLRRAVAQATNVVTNALEDGRALAEAGETLADSVRRARMLPFGSACESLHRLVRDVSTATGKPARLTIAGADIEADRPVLDALKDSLLHLVRNAIDHGVDGVADRAQALKPEVATISIRAALHGERLTVTVADDGAGLDIAFIRRKLAERGIVVPEADADVARMLFQAGFSTRDAVTTISGRGVGLDAVEAAMARVRGTVSVSWVAGAGTTFTLQCPLTLAAIRAVLVRSGTQVLAIPTSNVEHLVRIRRADVRRAEGREVILTGAEPIPLVPLATILGPPFVPGAMSDIFPALVVSAGDQRVAFLVDAVETELELVVRPIARGRSLLPHVSGGSLQGSGELVLVLNPVSLVHQALGSRFVALAGSGQAVRRRVLVVDDSMTTRALEQSVLEAAGFEVSTAVDGADAWRQLQESGTDLLVSDIEMPNMDGLALTRTVRTSERFANLPVILVTSLDTPEARERGLAAGADAYVGKASAGQAGLLATVQDLLA
ncbi:MAG: response regulator [Gemmatimonadota bacterium]|nr:response regulator [Gemmatimonadota bacterium]